MIFIGKTAQFTSILLELFVGKTHVPLKREVHKELETQGFPVLLCFQLFFIWLQENPGPKDYLWHSHRQLLYDDSGSLPPHPEVQRLVRAKDGHHPLRGSLSHHLLFLLALHGYHRFSASYKFLRAFRIFWKVAGPKSTGSWREMLFLAIVIPLSNMEVGSLQGFLCLRPGFMSNSCSSTAQVKKSEKKNMTFETPRWKQIYPKISKSGLWNSRYLWDDKKAPGSDPTGRRPSTGCEPLGRDLDPQQMHQKRCGGPY